MWGLCLAGALMLLSSFSCSAFYCSNSSNPVNCVPCAENITQYKCPKQCGEDVNATLCNTVCSSKCLDGECEYRKSGKLRCAKGCVESYTGSYCQKPCVKGCLKCRRKSRSCEKCERGLYGKLCDKKCANCLDETCLVSGFCTQGCKSGWFGVTCDESCDRCKKCDEQAINCTVCDRNNGNCLTGCDEGFYGTRCNASCPLHCTRCDEVTGRCLTCESGLFGESCQSFCAQCSSLGCDIENGTCVECDRNDTNCSAVPSTATSLTTGLPISEPRETSVVVDTTVVPPAPIAPSDKNRHGVKTVDEKNPDEEVVTGGGLASMFGDQDYLLPVIGCGLVVCAVIALVIFCKCRRKKSKKALDAEAHEGSKCNGVSLHPAVHRTSGDSICSRESILSKVSSNKSSGKNLLLDTVTSSGSPFGDKSFCSMRQRSSIPFMDPIAEDEEEDEEESDEESDSGGRHNINIYLRPEDLMCSSVSLENETLKYPEVVIEEADDKSCDVPSANDMVKHREDGSPVQAVSGHTVPNGTCGSPLECLFPLNKTGSCPSTPESCLPSPVIDLPEAETGYSSMDAGDTDVGESESDALVSFEASGHKPKYISNRGGHKSRIPRAYRHKGDNGTRPESDCPSERELMLAC